ncbi:MAG TPA: transcription termination/antitermination NusG family protein [Terracidiphilus sp.]
MYEGPWQVLHVTANHEKKIAQHLAIRSLDHYLPLYSERSRWSDRYVTLERPLFTGYLFVRCPAQDRLTVISVPGVLRLLGDSISATVSSEEIARIREGLASGCLLRPHYDLPIGTRVRVRRGIFEGAEGIVSEIRHRCKVILTLSVVRQCFSLEVDRDDIDILRGEVHKAAFAASQSSHRRSFPAEPSGLAARPLANPI